MAEQLAALLPEVIRTTVQDSAPLKALVAVADDLQAPVHETLDALPRLLDPYSAPAGMLRYLAHWVDLGWLLAPGQSAGGGATPTEARLRDLVAHAADLSAARGTATGLCRFLHLATGIGGFAVVPGEAEFTVTVVAPPEAEACLALVRRIVAATKPAHISATVQLAAAADPPPAETDPGVQP